jgi:hypothetical protein
MAVRNFTVAAFIFMAGFVHGQNNDTLSSSGPDCACSKLFTQYGDAVLYPSSTGFEEQRIEFWDIRSNLLPACIFFPKNAEEVGVAVSTFSNCGAQFAVRSGGHMNVSSRL